MKAVVYTRYGSPDVLSLTDIERPVPTHGEVLVRVRAVSLNLSDWEALRGTPFYARVGGLRRPRRHILGSDIAGQVAAVGPGVTRLQPGDDVYGDILSVLGGFAEFVRVPESLLAPLPDGMSYEEAAALPQAAAIAHDGILQKGRVQSGQRVLINGAGGGSGMYAIQLAKLHGATVTGVDNAEKLAFMRSLGADSVLDYRQTDYTQTGDTYDLILDLVAYRSPFAYRRALAPGGRYLCVGGPVPAILGVLFLGPLLGSGGRKIRVLAVKLGVKHLAPMIELCTTGQITTYIDRRFALAEVPEALRYVGEGHAKGKVVITIG
jgi:NADPH:quinone reductase-like Zn-dependent oxidoreductase